LWETDIVVDELERSSKRPSVTTTGAESMRIAMDVFYASLRACPWAKELYMLGFSNKVLSHALGEKGLKQVYQSMLERGLRIRLDISNNLDL
jgi:hypothetical protein